MRAWACMGDGKWHLPHVGPRDMFVISEITCLLL